jgi:hypothetical protein
MSDSPDSIINYNVTHNTVIRTSKEGRVIQIFYPGQIPLQSHQGTIFSNLIFKIDNHKINLIIVISYF